MSFKSSPAPTIAGYRALIVEDQPIHQSVLMSCLQKFGMSYDIASDGQEALNKLADTHDIVLMDCLMPNMDGYQATTKIREQETARGHWRPIIAVTAESLNSDRKKCFQAGMDDYLTKPLQVPELERVLQKWLLPVEHAAIQQFAGMKVRGKDLITALLEDYSRTAPEFLEKMRQAVSGNDIEALKQAVHAFKTASATLGAHRVAAICRDLEKATVMPGGASQTLDSLEAEIKKSMKVLNER